MKNIIPEKVNIAGKLAMFSDHWNPRIVAELNGQQVKLVKFKGKFVWLDLLPSINEGDS